MIAEPLVAEQEKSARLHARWLLAVALLAVLTYANSIPNGFAYDDVYIIQKNERVHQLGDLRSIWLTPYWPTNGTTYGLYRPLAIFGYAVQWALSGGAPWFFHVGNVLLHTGVSLLVFVLLARLTTPVGALLGAALFAVHPVHTEVVANVVGQAELLAAAGSLAACLLFIDRREGGIGRGRWLAIAVLYAAAMLAKESAIVLPALLVAVDFAYERQRRWYTSLLAHARAILPAILLLAPLAVAFLGLRVYVLGSIAGTDAAPWLPFLREDGRVFVALRAWMEYVRLLFWPMDLSADYSPGVILPVTSVTPAVLAGAGFFAATVIFTLALPKRPDVGLPAAWFLFAILPVSNLLVPVGIVVAERTLYLPSFAVSVAAAYAWTALERGETRRRARKLAAAAVAAVLVLFGGRSVLRNPEWKSTDTILSALLRDHPESYRAQWYAAHLATQRGDTKAAAEHWGLACRLWPRDAVLLTECGAHYLRAAQPQRAVEYLEASRAMQADVARTQGLLAQAYLLVGRPEDALRAAEHAMRVGSPEPVLQQFRASAYTAMGDHERAAHAARAAVSAGSGAWTDWAFYARTLFEGGSLAAAAAALDTAYLRAGEDERALNVLAALRDSLSMGTSGLTTRAGAKTRDEPHDHE